MNHSGMGHLKGMAVIVGGVFVLLLLLGKAPGEALSLAAIVACPLMMVGMMLGGGHGGDAGHEGHSGHEGHKGAGRRPDGQDAVGGSATPGRAVDAAERDQGPACH